MESIKVAQIGIGHDHSIPVLDSLLKQTDYVLGRSTCNSGHRLMFFLGCHLIDAVLHVMGDPEEIISVNMSTA